MMNWAGRNIVITGANRGIGRALVEYWDRCGANVLMCMRTVDAELVKLAESARRNGQNHQIVMLDLLSSDSIKAAHQRIAGWSREIDVLVNNAGAAYGSLATMTPPPKLREIFQINFFGQIEFTQFIARLMMKRNQGSIVFVGSTAGIRADEGTLAYGSSKAALMHAARILATEFAPYKIRVNAIAPSVTATDMLEEMTESALAKLTENSLLGRVLSVDDVVNYITFIASDSARNINGQVLKIDGGSR